MILADTGFWLALLNRRDAFYRQAAEAAQQWAGEGFVCSWPVVAETCHMLAVGLGNDAAVRFVNDLSRGACEIMELPPQSLSRMHKLMFKYSDLPMDLADASLVVLAEELGEGRILSTDERDFRAYRWKNSKPFKNLLISND